ncbi:MAG TPA: APC family permease [Acidimicrobiales bacterium]|nr:APC family permease [Acidimicrobiales bacterium]
MTMTEVEGPFGVPVPERERAANLKADELNLFDSTAVAISSVAPAYSLATTTVFLFTTVGVAYLGPSVLWVSFVPVLFIAYSYFHLNRRDPDCGASYAWLSKFMSPSMGWFNGWVQIATSVIFCVAAPVTAAQNTLQFFVDRSWIASSTATNPWLQAVVAALWLALVTFICIWGIRWTTNFQWIMVIIEYVCVIVFSIWAITKVFVSHPAGTLSFQWAWLNPLNIKSFGALAAGAALGVFFFWGWDTSVNLNEESKNKSKTPGHAAIISMFFLLVIFTVNVVAVQMWVPSSKITELANANQATTVMTFFAQHAIGQWALYVMLIAVLSSTVGTTQTTLLPAARVTLSMARDRVFPKLFASIEPTRQTPAIGTLVIALICVIGIFLTQGSPTISSQFGNLIDQIGVLVGFYYGITGIACAWAYRKVAFKDWKFFLHGVALPFLSGVALLAVGCEVGLTEPWTTSLPTLITMALGIPAVVLLKIFNKGPFFKVKPIAFTTIEE